jgi:hypothetical protein
MAAHYFIPFPFSVFAAVVGAVCLLPLVAVMFFVWLAGNRRRDS